MTRYDAEAQDTLYSRTASGESIRMASGSVFKTPLERQIQEALKEDPDPGTGPQHRRYVPGSVRPQVLQWGHSSPDGVFIQGVDGR